MKPPLRVSLDGTPEQVARLRALQIAFAEVCNAIAPVVQSTRCWNRVALHHLVYHPMRQRYPALGSQMVCNAIYSVCRTARLVLQHPKSPWNVGRHPTEPLPLLRFAPTAPVFFDRHTLSLRGRSLSMFTLDGRMHFSVELTEAEQERFRSERLVEVMLTSTPTGFDLSFEFAGARIPATSRAIALARPMPEYVRVVPASANAGLVQTKANEAQESAGTTEADVIEDGPR